MTKSRSCRKIAPPILVTYVTFEGIQNRKKKLKFITFYKKTYRRNANMIKILFICHGKLLT